MIIYDMLGIHENARKYLENNGFVFEDDRYNKDTDIVICGLERPEIKDGVKCIACPMTDTTHLGLHGEGITILNLHNAPILKEVYATAEHIMFLIFNALRPNAFATDRFKRPPEPYRELTGKKVFIFGEYGRIGTQLKKMLSGFDVMVDGIDLSGKMAFDGSVSIETADIIVSCIDNHPSNKDFFNADFFKSLKQDAIFINTSRGNVVDEYALANWLVERPAATAMIDVIKYEDETRRSPLWEVRNLIHNLFITPHIGGYTKKSREKTDMYIAEQIVRWADEQ